VRLLLCLCLYVTCSEPQQNESTIELHSSRDDVDDTAAAAAAAAADDDDDDDDDSHDDFERSLAGYSRAGYFPHDCRQIIHLLNTDLTLVCLVIYFTTEIISLIIVSAVVNIKCCFIN